MRLALIGHGHVARALEIILKEKRAEHPFEIAGVHTRSRPTAPSIEEFLDDCRADAMVELTTLNPKSGEPAISHIREALARGMHVVTANKGPIAFAYDDLLKEAGHRGVKFRFESTVMDGAPVFNQVRNNLPGVRIEGFTGVLNSTTKLVIESMENGGTFEDGLAAARALGVAEADASYDIDGWDSAAKTAALANVLLGAHTTPQAIERSGIGELTPSRVAEINRAGKTVRLVSRGMRTDSGVALTVRAEEIDGSDILASIRGTSNLILLHTREMGTVGTVLISPRVEQTAYGVYIDLMDLI